MGALLVVMRKAARRVPVSLRRVRRHAGFTLIEIVVAAAVFALLVGTVAGIYARFIQSERSNIGQTTLLGDVQSFLELLEREVRTGYGTSFGPSGSGTTFYFKNQSGACVKFFHDDNAFRIVRVEASPPCDPSKPATFSSSPEVTMNSLDVSIVSLEFLVQGQSVRTGADNPPNMLDRPMAHVTVRVRACPKGVADERCIRVQTTLTSRQYAPAP